MVAVSKVFLWCGIILCALCIYQMYLERKQDPIKNGSGIKRTWEISDRVYLILLAVAAAAALGARLYQFGAVPGGFNPDGAMAAVDAKALAEHGTDRYGMRLPVHLTAWGSSQMSTLLSYLLVPFIKVFGFSPVVLRLPQLLVSLAGLVCLYFFMRDVFGKYMALTAFMFAAINPWHIMQSRWILDCNLYAHFFLFGVYFLHRGIAKAKRKWLLLSMVFFGLCMYCYGVSIYTMPLFLVMACVYLLAAKKLKIAEVLWCALVYLLIAWPFILVMMINFFKWETIETPLFTLPYFPDSIRSNDILFFSENIGVQLIENFKSLINVTFLQVKDLPWNDIKGYGTMYLFSMPFVVLGLIALFKRNRKNPGAMLLFFFLMTGIFCGLLTNRVNVNRINIIYYPIIMLAGIGLYEAARLVPVSRWLLPVCYGFAFCLFVRVYFTTYAGQIRDNFLADYGRALAAAKEMDVDKYYISLYGSQTMTETYVLFYHQLDAEFFQGKTEIEGDSFEDRYIIGTIQEDTVDPTENAAYVVSGAELESFNTELFDIQQFGNYYTLQPK